MVHWEEIRDLLRKRPFQPFRVDLTDGRSFTIEYPLINAVIETSMTIGFPTPNDPDPLAERRIFVDLNLIERVTVFDYPSPWKSWYSAHRTK
jgi:hypothetical protein